MEQMTDHDRLGDVAEELERAARALAGLERDSPRIKVDEFSRRDIQVYAMGRLAGLLFALGIGAS